MTDIKFGQSIPRREDDRLLTGRGQYVDDVQHAGALTAVFVRSPYPNARILSIDGSAALAHAGVVAVLTSAEVRADGVNESPRPFRLPRADGGESVETRRPLLAEDRVRFVGEPVALVGVFVALMNSGVRVAVTGAASSVFRCSELEQALARSFTPDAARAVVLSPDGMASDLHASAEYRAHLVPVIAARAVALALQPTAGSPG